MIHLGAKTIIDTVLAAVKKEKDRANTTISIDSIEPNLLTLKEYIESTLASRTLDLELERYKIEGQQSVEMFRSIIAYAATALKSAIFINGGAAVALLAFIGKIWDKNGIPQTAVESIVESLTSFSFGVFFAAVGMVFAYFAQYHYGKGSGKNAQESLKDGSVFHLLAVVSVLISISLFGFGVHLASSAFVDQFATLLNQKPAS